MKKVQRKKVLLCILDGFGEYKDYSGNAVTRAKTPHIHELRKKYPWTLLKTDGNSVGLPEKTQGGSEVGHFTMGAGRTVFQSLENINRSIKSGDFFKLKFLREAARFSEDNKSAFHIIGMISDEGVHAHINHLFTLLEFAKKRGLKNVYIHAITDGRDVPPRTAKKYIKMVQDKIKKIGVGKIATIVGRFYAMDRDTNWERTKIAYDLYTTGKGTAEKDPLKAIDNAYKRQEKNPDPSQRSDYYMEPILIDQNGLIKTEDSVVCFNYRTDRARQITKAFVKRTFRDFKRENPVNPLYVCFGPYSARAPVLFPAEKVKNNLGSFLSKQHLKQLRIAETEKYAHVTYFFNSQVKDPYTNETRVMIDSKKSASYAQTPEMSAKEITDRLIQEMEKDLYDVIILNFANGDLVGHSGDFKAAVQAVEVLDECLGRIEKASLETGYNTIITADHGNVEYMKYEKDGSPCPSHTRNPVICLLISEENKKKKLHKGELCDIAPTVLDLLQITPPKQMTGKSLIG